MNFRISILTLIVASLLYACDSCENCGPLVFEPSVELIFINADSAKTLTDSITNNTELRTALNTESQTFEDTLGYFNTFLDSIRNEQRVNENPDSLFLNAQITLFTDSLNTNDSTVVVLDSLNGVMNPIVTTINSGLLNVSSITVQPSGNGLTLEEDSATSYSIPLSYDQSFDQYIIELAGESFELELTYEVYEEVDDDRRVRLRAEAIEVTSHSFDSLIYECETNCTDDNAVFTCYF